MLSIILCFLLQTAPQPSPATEVAPIAPETLDRMAEQSLHTDGLREDAFASDLWSALLERTKELIERRHEIRTLKARMDSLAEDLAKLHQFIEDHEQLVADYTAYREVIDETKRLTEAEHATRRQQERFEKERRREAARQKQSSEKNQQQQATAKNRRLKNLGFSEIGDNVWLSKSAYAYASKTVPEQRVFYQQGPTGIMQPMTAIENRSEIDYSKMTISGSLLNGDSITRNIGVAFVFRDAHDNQIGQETVIIENARPEVPYPFTGELILASDRAFASMTSWVLFADTAPPATTSNPATPPPGSQPAPPAAPVPATPVPPASPAADPPTSP